MNSNLPLKHILFWNICNIAKMRCVFFFSFFAHLWTLALLLMYQISITSLVWFVNFTEASKVTKGLFLKNVTWILWNKFLALLCILGTMSSDTQVTLQMLGKIKGSMVRGNLDLLVRTGQRSQLGNSKNNMTVFLIIFIVN